MRGGRDKYNELYDYKSVSIESAVQGQGKKHVYKRKNNQLACFKI
jgi:hypothetical protein